MTFRSSKSLSPDKALVRLEDYCVRAEHCSAEMYEKLAKWGISGTDADEIVASLVARSFINDRRFACAFVRDRYRFGSWGRRKIVMALRNKKIGGDIIEEALQEIDNKEYIRLLAHQIVQKAKTLPESGSFESRQKILRFVAGRGYELQLALKIMEKLL